MIFKGLLVSKNVSEPLVLWNSIFKSRLQLTVQIQLALHPCDPFLKNNCNMNDNGVES